MTTRNLQAFFQPRAIALIGASNELGSVGAVLARNLLESGFKGPILTVNPHEAAIRSTLNFHSVDELPMAPDLAVIATPPAVVPGVIAELGARGCRAAIVITAGLGGERRQAMLDASRPHLLRIVGPNCLGFISPARGINASFAHVTPQPGCVALVAQSGAITTALLDWAVERGFGFSHIVTLGDAADVDFGDLLDYLALDRETKAILLYVESISDARKFMSAGRIAARTKPVMVIKAGRTAAGAKAALSHTGALAGSDLVFEAAFRRAGMLRVHELRDLFDAVTTLTSGVAVSGDRLTILTNGGGAGVLAADALEQLGGHLAELTPATIACLDKDLPPTWSRANPVDIIGDASGARYVAALEALLGDEGSDAILVMNCPTAVADSSDAARAVLAQLRRRKKPPPVLTCWLGARAAAEPRRLFATSGVPSYDTPDEAVRAFMDLVHYRRNQRLLLETPPASSDAQPNVAEARRMIQTVLDEGRSLLTDPEAKIVLKAYGIPVAESRVSISPRAAVEAASVIGGAVALKILSPDITHKSDVGGVLLNLAPDAVEAAATEMLARVAEKAPDARVTGFVVQSMVISPHAHELIAGIATDPGFGPVILFGQGGTAVEVIGDRAVGLPPLNPVLAHEVISRTRIARLLAGYRDRPAVDLDAVAAVLVRLSHLATEVEEVVELDINPLAADETGVLALDARIRVQKPAGGRRRRTAIRPYPEELAGDVALPGGESILIRPVRPEDAPSLVELVARSSREDVRLRFHAGLKELPHKSAARLSQIDYDREMALVGFDPVGAAIGVARFAADPEGETAEFALMVRTDQQNRGIGRTLLGRLVEVARGRGLRTLWGEVMSVNHEMLTMADAFGFVRSQSEDPAMVRITLGLE